MTESVAVLQSRLDAIRKAYHSGVLTVTHGDTTTTFRNRGDMERIMSSLEADIAGSQGTKRRKIRYLYQSDKGL